MDNSHEAFDKYIRQQLQNLQDDNVPLGWNELQQQLNAESVRSTDPFDDFIKTKLENAKPEYDPGFWSLMQSKIDADDELKPQDIEDSLLDELVYENLQSYHVPYEPKHWEVMLQRIQKEFSIQHQLYKYKVAEISLMLLAIFTLLQFLPISPNLQEAKKHILQKLQNNEARAPIAHFNDLNLTNAEEDFAFAKNSNHKNLDVNKDTQNQEGQSKARSAGHAVASDNSTALPPTPQNTTGTIDPIPHSNISKANNLITQNGNIATRGHDLSTSQKIPLALSAPNPPTTPALQIEELETSNELSPALHKPMPLPLSWTFQLGMMTSFDFNLVMTPYDEYFSLSSYRQITSGYTSGFVFDARRKRISISTGMLYSAKQYEPKENIELKGSLLEGYITEEFDYAQVNIISIPANFSYAFGQSGKWQWYSLLGLSAKIAVVNNYDFKSQPISFKAMQINHNIQDVEEEHESPAKPYAGIFEGGTWRNNFFLSANLGLGMERYLSPRWSIFVQPIYQHSIYQKGLGPKKDRIHNMSIYLGTKARL